LDSALLVHTEDRRMHGRFEIQPDNVSRRLLKLGSSLVR
jgi:hypothetical protein